MAEKTLLLDVKGATDQDIERGRAVALEIFDVAGTTPFEAAFARFKRDGEQEVTEREAQIADLWDVAQRRRDPRLLHRMGRDPERRSDQTADRLVSTAAATGAQDHLSDQWP